jgi:hypothetical protein
MSKVAEVQVALASGAMREAGDEWVVAVGGATKKNCRCPYIFMLLRIIVR